MSIKPERRPNWGIKYWEGVFSIKLDFSKRMTSHKPSPHTAQNTKKSLIKYTNEGLLVEKTGYFKKLCTKRPMVRVAWSFGLWCSVCAPRDVFLSGRSPLGLRFRLFYSLMPSLAFLSPPSLQSLAFSLLPGARSPSRRTGPESLGASLNTHTGTRWRCWDPPPAYQTLTGSV